MTNRIHETQLRIAQEIAIKWADACAEVSAELDRALQRVAELEGQMAAKTSKSKRFDLSEILEILTDAMNDAKKSGLDLSRDTNSYAAAALNALRDEGII